MLIMNCTKAAVDFFTKIEKGQTETLVKPAHESVLKIFDVVKNFPSEWQWMVHAVKVKRKNVLVVMDYNTRFSITLSELKKGDYANFIKSFEHHLFVHVYELLMKIGLTKPDIDQSIKAFQERQNEVAYLQRGDRSVQATINDVVSLFRDYADGIGQVPTGADLISQDVFVNQLLRKPKWADDYFYPHHHFLHQWLLHYVGFNLLQADAALEYLEEKEREAFLSKMSPISEPNYEVNAPKHVFDRQPQATPEVKPTPEYSSRNVVYMDAFRKK